ncbi:MAG TPA: VanZ family protein [Telluria sp.]|nr:VanZ family protein [Telluria sp.]
MPSSLPAPDDSAAAPARRPPVQRPAPVSRAPAHVFLAAVVVFIVYGSLFPFDFVGDGLPLEKFFSEDQIFGNRSDAIDNFFLFVPLGIALHLSFRRPAARLAAALLAVLVLAVGIQLVQLYLPSRTASLADAFWNTVGMGAGFLVASRVHRAFRAQLAERPAGRDHFLLCLVALWFLYESFPFVPTLDLGLLREHVKGAVFASTFELMRLAQHALAAALAGIAITRAGVLRRTALGVGAIGAVAIVLEVIVPYGSLRRETLIGIALGLAAGYLVARRARDRAAHVAFALALATYLITVLTPYRGLPADGGFTFTPFSHVLWHGVVNGVPVAAFEALAIGALLWSGMAGAQRWRDRPILWCALVLLLLAVLEVARFAVLGFHGDSTALVMALVLAPAAVALRAAGSGAPLSSVAEPAPVGPPAAPAPGSRSALVLLAGSAAALTVAVWVLLQLPGIPYNLKKLFGEHTLFGAAVFSLALLWLGGGPWLAARAMLQLEARRRRAALWAPLLVVAIALVSYVLVDLATPAIMLDKIIGAPDLYRRIVEDNYWGDAWRTGVAAWPRGLFSAAERVVRYVALYSVPAMALLVAALALPRQDRRARVIVTVLCLLPFWLLAKYLVLDWAITDNLTELVADGGTPWLAVLIALFAFNGVALVAWRGVVLRAAVSAALACAGWWLLNQGIESAVVNNGRLFSGVQFLLGQDRVTLLSAPALFSRWCLAYGAGLAVVAAGMALSMRLAPLPGAVPQRRR